MYCVIQKDKFWLTDVAITGHFERLEWAWWHATMKGFTGGNFRGRVAAGIAGEALTVGREKDAFDYIQPKKRKPKDQCK
uniref:Uncharacterized protein n=1 Tax=Apteryx owenii TaxID=8824 RepID=A0A8B9PPN3_APTOW